MAASDVCPLCSGPLLTPRAVDVCGGCASSVEVTGSIQMSNTAEFAAVSSLEVATLQGSGDLEDGPAYLPRVAVACTWCGKPQVEVKKLLSGGGANICNECVALCSDILLAELGPDWR